MVVASWKWTGSLRGYGVRRLARQAGELGNVSFLSADGQCNELAQRWDESREKTAGEGFAADDVKSFNSTQMGELPFSLPTLKLMLVVFLEKVESFKPFPKEHVASLEKLYALDKSDNAEIKLRFFQIALKSGPEFAEKAAGELRNLALMLPVPGSSLERIRC